MIKKIEINNVGRFKSAKTEGDEQFFKKNTFIYGKNTFGKSTLTSIFRSLREDNVDYIIGRKTIGGQKQLVRITPEVTTPIGEYRFTTDEAKWNAEYKDIVVFDNHFVRESVYTQNQQIGQEQQKNIEAFMLGAKGVEYNVKISALIDQISENTRIQTSISGEYSRNKSLLGGLPFDDFLALKEVVDIDKKIEKEQKELDKVKNSQLISSKLGNIKDLLEGYKDIDVSQLDEKLSVNSELITKHFEQHINQDETKQSYGSFLQAGSKLRNHAKDERCPFCTQKINDVEAKEFLKTIDLIYNEKYKSLQQAIRRVESLFPQATFATEIDKIKTDLKQAGYILETDFSNIDILLNSCRKAVSDKKDDLSKDLNEKPFKDISEKANAHIKTIDAELVNFKNPSERKIQIESSLKKLEANRERFGSWNERCSNYLKAKKDSKSLGTQKEKLWNEYLEYANGLSATMLQDINDILDACNCDFKVQKFSFKGNQRQDLFVLNMSGSPISNNGSDTEMSIKNCLSDSDKWILAFAFFLATIKNDRAIKVVVMDDPVSSFDVDRKRIILNEIKKIMLGTDKQLILLTHEKGFYQLIHSEGGGDASVTFLRITLDSKQGSKLTQCDPHEDDEFMSDYNCWINDLKNALVSHDLSTVKNAHGCIRKVIEHVLKVKYPLELTKELNTVESMLTKLEEPGSHYSTTSKRSEINSVLINLTHHDNSASGQYPAGQLGIEDYRKDIKETFKLIKTL